MAPSIFTLLCVAAQNKNEKTKIIWRCALGLAKIVSCLPNKTRKICPRRRCHKNRKVRQVQRQVRPLVCEQMKECYITKV